MPTERSVQHGVGDGRVHDVDYAAYDPATIPLLDQLVALVGVVVQRTG